MGACEHADVVKHLDDALRVAGGQTSATLDDDSLLDPTLALRHEFKEAFVDPIDLLADIAHGQVCRVRHDRLLPRLDLAGNVSKRRDPDLLKRPGPGQRNDTPGPVPL